MTKSIKWTYLIFFLLAISCSAPQPSSQPSSSSDANDQIFRQAFDERARNLPVKGHGTVKRVLSDDNKGSKHQRFILELASGQTLLIAHNVDLAPRVSGLQEGDEVEFSGEYEWNPEGGVVHWTHHDPRGQHSAGWLKHGGKTYQ